MRSIWAGEGYVQAFFEYVGQTQRRNNHGYANCLIANFFSEQG